MEKIVLVGAGGHCKVIIDIIKSTSKYDIVGVTDKAYACGEEALVLDIPIIGDDSILKELYNTGVKNAFVCVGALQNIVLRDKIYMELLAIGFNIPALIHKGAIVSPYANVAFGTCVMAGVIINPGAFIEENCIINTGAVIEHDCKVQRNTHISPRASIAGGVNVGCNTHIGMGSSIIQSVQIGNNVIIGAGAVVIENIVDNVVAVGIPAKIIKRR
ncbi:NeuD/PglB/VioB family sugar acetyltransferase [Clostridium tagluense]|uniref:NeuD/PglB/VioB family sugar acetyltransferase n=1 Tax=Clostridium TaxID=1485 RepID=UPI0013E93460|nr:MULTISPECIES: NeuD/PglB/VioB family sugar acetyltransferase [Clostridium]MBU3126093.1 NeuD/PglB/VioB family sugar acetyltransferase [Clostridium tagluense]MBW9155773.1 NeuD/PglB/VioB family sugar acetyltransferase [Clostridium tagluense]MBZ9623934.1 NeuD/PglB/VioB family sugar acetyltransferase [Clostridium sp. FP2]MCB2311693.1 NeuD/PglB/VioB family sugar acetyltransferase [Clostridium tagluense]MCB2316417.1 NeuD/PglB/VioB family sugar acetyltransferase [Clostridium tagluense]